MASGYEKHDCGVRGGTWSDETKPPSLRERLANGAVVVAALTISLAPLASVILGAFN